MTIPLEALGNIQRSTLRLNNAVENLAALASHQIAINQECFVAQWILQNPDKLISEHTLFQRTDWFSEGCPTQFWIEKKVHV